MGPADAGATHAAVAQGLARVRARMRDAERRFGREPGSVALLAVSKVQAPAKIAAAFDAGQTAFGESYIQEAVEKMDALAGLPLEWHFIGRIQANKTRLISERFDWVHSLGDLQHARRLGAQRPPGHPPLKVCIQVNLSGEPTKGGLAPDALAGFIAAASEIEGIHIEGLMTLPAPTDDFDAQRGAFAHLRTLRDQVAQTGLPLATLSMGMSDDLEAAIAEGASIVRVGTALFGPRQPREPRSGADPSNSQR